MFELKDGMDRYVIDFTDVSRANDFHDIIRDALDFPDWYGKNWDAFNDLLSTECDADKVIIKGEKSLPKELDKALAIMHEILERNKQDRANSDSPFDYEIIN